MSEQESKGVYIPFKKLLDILMMQAEMETPFVLFSTGDKSLAEAEKEQAYRSLNHYKELLRISGTEEVK